MDTEKWKNEVLSVRGSSYSQLERGIILSMDAQSVRDIDTKSGKLYRLLFAESLQYCF